MTRRVKKTDSREIDHWVTSKRGKHLPIDKDGNIIFGSSKKSTSKSGSNKTKSTSKKSKVEFKEFKPEPWMDEEEMAEALFDSKDYIGDRALYQGVKDDLKSSGYSMGTKLTVDKAELVEYDGKSRYGTVEATYTIRDNGDFYGKKGTEYTERFRVPVVKDYSNSDSKNTSGAKSGTKTSRQDTSRANLSNGKPQLPSYRSAKSQSYSQSEKIAASVGAFGNNRKAARHLKSENRRSMLMEIAEDAGVSSAKLRKMDTEDIRAMLLSMLRA